MNLMVIGSGGREHAIIKKLKENPQVETIYALPGNGGIAADAVCVPIGATELDKQAEFAKTHQIDYAVVTPDDPLALGAVDLLQQAGIACFGPTKQAARIESSKVFAKDLMKRYHIPTANYETFSDPAAACRYLDAQADGPIVVKADGLALGKGVILAKNRQEAKQAVHSMMEEQIFGASGTKIVIEEFLEGPEVSVLSFTDGTTIVPMISSMDHKRALDGDAGLNTGGMGTIAPNPFYTKEVAARCMQEIFLPTIHAMQAEGCPFQGCLYFGLMLTKDGPKVIEYNCRFGDPETQVVLPLLQSDLLTVMQATTNHTLANTPVVFSDEAACCVILASQGYPLHYERGFAITLSAEAAAHIDAAGVKLQGGQLVTNGGRVLGVTATAHTLPEAIQEAYRLVKGVSFQNAFYRTDIGQRALRAEEE